MSSIILPWERGAAYDYGAQTPLGQMSSQEEQAAKQYYTDQIMKMEEGILRYQVETIEQYGTVRTAIEQKRNAVAVALINGEARLGAAKTEGEAEIKAAQYIHDLPMIAEGIYGSKHTQDRLWKELVKATSGSWATGDTQIDAKDVITGDGDYQRWLTTYQDGVQFQTQIKKGRLCRQRKQPVQIKDKR